MLESQTKEKKQGKDSKDLDDGFGIENLDLLE